MPSSIQVATMAGKSPRRGTIGVRSQQGGPEDPEQHQSLATELLSHHAAEDLCGQVAVEVRRQHHTLHCLIPVELTRLDTSSQHHFIQGQGHGHCQRGQGQDQQGQG